MNALKSAAIMFKLDSTKAFDTVDWASLLQVMAKLGFGQRWVSIMDGLLSMASTRVVMNGVAGDLIYNRLGLLFESIMDVLHLMLEDVHN